MVWQTIFHYFISWNKEEPITLSQKITDFLFLLFSSFQVMWASVYPMSQEYRLAITTTCMWIYQHRDSARDTQQHPQLHVSLPDVIRIPPISNLKIGCWVDFLAVLYITQILKLSKILKSFIQKAIAIFLK